MAGVAAAVATRELTAIALTAAQQYTCGSWGTMLGGYKVFGRDDFARKTFEVLEPHTHLRVQLRFYKLDRWDWHEYGYITVDGVHAWSAMLLSRNQKDGERMCGYGGSTALSADASWQYNDKYVDVDFIVPHQAGEATINVFTNLQDGDEFWGIGEVRVTAGTDLPEAFAATVDAAAATAAEINHADVVGPFGDNVGLGILAIGLLLGSGAIMIMAVRWQWRVLQRMRSSALKKAPGTIKKPPGANGGSLTDIVAVIAPSSAPAGPPPSDVDSAV